MVASNDDDTKILSRIIAAQELNPALFTVARQNRGCNADLFEAANVDLVMDRSDIIAHRILALITTPLLAEFFAALDNYDEPAINELVSRLAAVLDEVVPDIWTVVVGAEQAPAVIDALDSGRDVGLSDLGRNPHGAGSLHCFPLLLRRSDERRCLPGPDTPVAAGDHVLFCGREGAQRQMQWLLRNAELFHYACTGQDLPRGVVLRWLRERSGN